MWIFTKNHGLINTAHIEQIQTEGSYIKLYSAMGGEYCPTIMCKNIKRANEIIADIAAAIERGDRLYRMPEE